MNPFIYEEYTGAMSGVLQHLKSIQMLIPQDRVTIKVPIIPGFNEEADVDSDIAKIKERYGFTDVIKTVYKRL